MGGESVVVKAGINYQVCQPLQALIEEAHYERYPDAGGLSYNEETEEYIMTEEQKLWILPRVEEMRRTGESTYTECSDVETECWTHAKVEEKALQSKLTPPHRYYGRWSDVEHPYVLYYIAQRLDKTLLELGVCPNSIVRDLIQHLRTLHSAGYVHRDVTPMNCMVKDERGYLIDYGISYPIIFSHHYLERILEGKKAQTISLRAGNPHFAPASAFRGLYTPSGDLEGLVYTIEVLHTKKSLPWFEYVSNREDEKAYQSRLEFIPSHPGGRRLLQYLRERPQTIDYQLCQSFFE
jgi:hypothetical protein